MPSKTPPSRKTGKRSNRAKRFDMDLYLDTGFEAAVADRLQSEVRTRTILDLFKSDRERRILILLLCQTVFCREQNVKTDDAIELVAGITPHNVENARGVIENFCQWLWPHLHHNKDVLSFNEARNLIPTLLNIADVIVGAVPIGRQLAQDWNRNYVAAPGFSRTIHQRKDGTAALRGNGEIAGGIRPRSWEAPNLRRPHDTRSPQIAPQ